MELLDGGDLQQLAPAAVGGLLARSQRDVASALSLLHSRRLVHRDVSPRNVRRSADGLAKLIDFGAIAADGSEQVDLGHAAVLCAGERALAAARRAHGFCSRSARTLYFMLVGHHAYAAGSFAQLNAAVADRVSRAVRIDRRTCPKRSMVSSPIFCGSSLMHDRRTRPS